MVQRKRRLFFIRTSVLFLLVNLFFLISPVSDYLKISALIVPTVYADTKGFLVDIALRQGDLSMQLLEESGYSPIAQPLNPSIGDEIYLGYAMGDESNAVRDILVSSSGKETIEVGGNSYKRVSDIDLNKGSKGKKQYLYISHDKNAGEPIRGISFFVKKTLSGYSDDSPILASDGSELVITDTGKVANFDEGIQGSEIYLRQYKGKIFRPYVENVIIATANNEENVVRKLAEKRCTYFINCNLGKDKYILLGYTRTDDKKMAIKSLIAMEKDSKKNIKDEIDIKNIRYTPLEDGEVKGKKDYIFYMTRDEAAGNPIIDLLACGYNLEDAGLENDKFYRLYSNIRMKDWISKYFLRLSGKGSLNLNYLYEESQFLEKNESDEQLWISNIYCSDNHGKQFFNNIGYISQVSEKETNLFEQTFLYEKNDESNNKKADDKSAAAVFWYGVGPRDMLIMIIVIFAGLIISLSYKKYRKRFR